MKIWPKIKAKMSVTHFSPIASYYQGILAATELWYPFLPAALVSRVDIICMGSLRL